MIKYMLLLSCLTTISAFAMDNNGNKRPASVSDAHRAAKSARTTLTPVQSAALAARFQANLQTFQAMTVLNILQNTPQEEGSNSNV